jgi:hypothetical protein
MTLKRINFDKDHQADAENIIQHLNLGERIRDVSFVYEGEHPELGHTIVIMRGDGSTVIFADEVRFLKGGSEPGDA